MADIAKDGCPHCDNKFGFAFGTCCQCGFNHLDQTFHSIRINPADLPAEIRDWLITEHAHRTRRRDNG